MLRDLEVFMPTLFPVVLGDERGPVLSDLDLAAFGGLAREELTMAKRRLGETVRMLTAPGETAASARLAVLDMPFGGVRAGALAYVQATGASTIAYLADGTFVDAARGTVRLRRSVVRLSDPARRVQPMATGDKTTDTILKLANMAAAKLPGPAGTAISVATALVELFSSAGPTEAEIIISAIQKAITAAVAELESFIVDEKIKDIQADITAAYGIIKEVGAQARKATSLGAQLNYARRAVDQITKQFDVLKPKLIRLTLIAIPGDVGKDLRERAKAAKLLAHGTAALYTFHKLRLQFDAFLSINEPDARLRDDLKHTVRADRLGFKMDVFGDDRDFPTPSTGDPVEGSFILAYDEMVKALITDRAGCIVVSGFGSNAIMYFMGGRLVDPYRGIDNDINPGDWKHSMEGQGLPPDLISDYRRFEEQKSAYVSELVRRFIMDFDLLDNLSSLGRYLNLMRDWDSQVTALVGPDVAQQAAQ
jgi:hypothetical protein